jgi:sulfhydrogenase subunit beta (sulfur reductase)
MLGHREQTIMGYKVIQTNAVQEWIGVLRKTYRVIGPKPMHNQHIFDEVNSPEELDLAYQTTILPPKKVLLPQHEELIQFNTAGKDQKVNALIEQQPTVIMGVHTCDLHAIKLLDRVFSQGYPDQHYLARRKNLTIVTIECLSPCSEYAFCKSMGTLSVPEEFDLHITDLGEDYAIDIGSSKGLDLLRGITAAREATKEDYQRLTQVMGKKWARFPYKLEFDVTELPNLLSLSYDSVLWNNLGERCLACGMCTIVCPTCYCFDVKDEVDFTLSGGTRFRVWDSCQLDRFATVAGGHNFRATRVHRQRHRFFHKGKYITQAYGLFGCVGCGRCAQACLVHISPIDVFNELYRRQVPFASIAEEVMV